MADSYRPATEKDAVGQYLEQIAEIPLLNAEQEVELAKRIEAGLFAAKLLEEGRVGRKKGGAPGRASQAELEWLAEDGTNATEQFINANLRLSVSIARKYQHRKLPFLDIIQEGNHGLITAVQKFDFTRGTKFSTHATWWIRQAITRQIPEQTRTVRLPTHIIEKLNGLTKADKKLTATLGRQPEVEELAAELDKTADQVHDLLMWQQWHVSLETPIDDDGTTLGQLLAQETTPGPDEAYATTERNERLRDLLDLLDARDADFVRLRYGLADGKEYSTSEIGKRYHMSGERVRQVLRGALGRMYRLTPPDMADSESA